jgi:hypothetical protein
MRRLERQLIGEYRDSVTGALAQLGPGNHELVVRIAALPDLIRGYEQVKLGNVERYRSELGAARDELSRPEAAAAVSGAHEAQGGCRWPRGRRRRQERAHASEPGRQ